MKKPAKTAALAKTIQAVLAERRAVETLEKGIVDAVNSVLSKIGYKAVAVGGGPGKRRRRGRPPGRKAKRTRVTGRQKVARRGRPRKRGRPPKAK